MLEASFGRTPIRTGDRFTTGELIAKRLDVDPSLFSDDYYTLVMYDLDAPYIENPSISPYIHLLITNIHQDNNHRGETIIYYIPPNPPVDSPAHKYYISLYRQPMGYVTNVDNIRENYPLDNFINVNNLEFVSHNEFLVESGKKLPPVPPKKEIIRPYVRPSSPKNRPSKEEYFKDDVALTERQQSYCRCVLHVAAKNPSWCNQERVWGEKRDGKTCYNPYAVCAKSTKTSYRWCGAELDMKNIPDDELVAHAELRRINIPKPYDRYQLLSNIYAWKSKKEKL